MLQHDDSEEMEVPRRLTTGKQANHFFWRGGGGCGVPRQTMFGHKKFCSCVSSCSFVNLAIWESILIFEFAYSIPCLGLSVKKSQNGMVLGKNIVFRRASKSLEPRTILYPAHHLTFDKCIWHFY